MSSANMMFAFKKNDAKVVPPNKDHPTESVSRSGSADNGALQQVKIPSLLTPNNESGH